MGARRIAVPEYGSDGHARIMERAASKLALCAVCAWG
jgi:hypothetical protein